MLLCARPHVKDVDFSATARFIVSTASGLNVYGQRLVMGDEVPRGVLSVEALQQIYEPPQRLIETLEYAKEDPRLVEACARQGTSLGLTDLPEQSVSDVEDTSDVEDHPEDVVDGDEVLVMCDECGEMVVDLLKHTRKQCKFNQRKKK